MTSINISPSVELCQQVTNMDYSKNWYNMDYSKNCTSNVAILSLLIVGVLYISIWTPDVSKGFSTFRYQACPSITTTTQVTSQLDELGKALEGASMGNKTLIIAVINRAYVEGDKTMLDLFLDSFWLGENTQSLINHLLLVSVDQIAFDRCNFLKLHCYRLVTEGVDFGGEKLYMSENFIKMMWARTLFLNDVLEHGYSFIFTDTDIMWLRNPFLRLSQDYSEDMQLSCDNFNGKPWSKGNPMNTGFYFVRSNNRTISLFRTWYAMRNNADYKGMKEQDVLGKMMHVGVFDQLGIKVRFLDTLYISGFCRDSRDLAAVATVHANCCFSINAKVADLLAVLRVWKSFKTYTDDQRKLQSSGNDTLTFRWPKHVACDRSWKGFKGL